MSLQTDEKQSVPPVDDARGASEIELSPPQTARVIPPPPYTGSASEIRLVRPRNASEVPSYVWGQGDAFEIPYTAPPPADLFEVAPELRDTVRPGRIAL